MNDGAADPWGHFLIGSMAFDISQGAGSFYSYVRGNDASVVFDNVTVSNGIGWSPTRDTMYYVDSGPRAIYSFRVDAAGGVHDRKLIRSFDSPDGATPDGLCVDAEGALWVAMWDGSEVRRLSPSGELLATVSLPVTRPTCCALGGETGTTLFITTAREGLSDAELAQQPRAGRMFRVDVGIPGISLNSYDPD